MPLITLLEKAYGPFQPRMFAPLLHSLCKGLKVRLEVIGKTPRGWIQVRVSGEDEAVTLRYLHQRIGLAPTSIERLRKFSTVRGKVINAGKSREELYVDVGVYSPRVCDAYLPLRTLQAQLADGRKMPLWRITELFCLYNNFPLEVKVKADADPEQGLVEAELSEAQLAKFTDWINTRLDRLIVLGATASEVRRAVKASGHGRDVVRIERLGWLEHAIVCKLGTDAVGLIPNLGHLLPTSSLIPFRPREILRLVNRPYL